MKNIEYIFQKNIGAREDQQDNVEIRRVNDVIFIALGDGMGGHSGGAMASKILVETAMNNFLQGGYEDDVREFFQKIVYEAENNITKYQKQSGEDPHTTAAFALIKDGKIYFANIGDSRVYIFEDNKLVTRSRDHSVPEMLYQMGEIKEEEMATHPDQNKLTKSIGPYSHEKISYYEYELNPNKEFIVLVCSDGFWEYVRDNEVIEWISNFELDIAVHSLINIARERGGSKGDNISVGIVTNRLLKKNSSSTEMNEKKDYLKYIIVIIVILLLLIIGFCIGQQSSSSKDENKTKVHKSSIKNKVVVKKEKNVTKKIDTHMKQKDLFAVEINSSIEIKKEKKEENKTNEKDKK